MSIYGDRAYAAFFKGYNCCQSVAVAFAEEMGMTEKQALQISAGFGGGLDKSHSIYAIHARQYEYQWYKTYSLPQGGYEGGFSICSKSLIVHSGHQTHSCKRHGYGMRPERQRRKL